jgi:hypothetical protein
MEFPDEMMSSVRREGRGYLSSNLSLQFRAELVEVIVIPESFFGPLSFQLLDEVVRFQLLYRLADI